MRAQRAVCPRRRTSSLRMSREEGETRVDCDRNLHVPIERCTQRSGEERRKGGTEIVEHFEARPTDLAANLFQSLSAHLVAVSDIIAMPALSLRTRLEQRGRATIAFFFKRNHSIDYLHTLSPPSSEVFCSKSRQQVPALARKSACSFTSAHQPVHLAWKPISTTPLSLAILLCPQTI